VSADTPGAMSVGRSWRCWYPFWIDHAGVRLFRIR